MNIGPMILENQIEDRMELLVRLKAAGRSGGDSATSDDAGVLVRCP
ncbi:MAG: hypothetical protein ABI634_07270 [Acidobacteriota bacterium]